MGLSERREAMLGFIKGFLRDEGYPPTVREIARGVGISSTSVVNYHLNVLQDDGYIVRDKEVARGIRVTGQRQEGGKEEGFEVPVLGRIAAGEPIPVLEAGYPDPGQESIRLTSDIVPSSDGLYGLEVRGQSMIDALVDDGDVVILRHQEHAANGDMVAAWLREEKETTLKRFYLEGDRVRLQPANPAMDPIYVPATDVEVQGKVVLVIRRNP